jgi:hypothetical protein
MCPHRLALRTSQSDRQLQQGSPKELLISEARSLIYLVDRRRGRNHDMQRRAAHTPEPIIRKLAAEEGARERGEVDRGGWHCHLKIARIRNTNDANHQAQCDKADSSSRTLGSTGRLGRLSEAETQSYFRGPSTLWRIVLIHYISLETAASCASRPGIKLPMCFT